MIIILVLIFEPDEMKSGTDVAAAQQRGLSVDSLLDEQTSLALFELGLPPDPRRAHQR